MLGLALGGVSRADDTPKQRASAVLEAAARDGFSGTVCVESGGATLVDSAFGWADDRHSRRVDPDTLYHVASVTKLVTAIAVLKLAEQRKLALADPLGKWFPEAPPDKAAITIEQLLLHQSGSGRTTPPTASPRGMRPCARCSPRRSRFRPARRRSTRTTG